MFESPALIASDITEDMDSFRPALNISFSPVTKNAAAFLIVVWWAAPVLANPQIDASVAISSSETLRLQSFYRMSPERNDSVLQNRHSDDNRAWGISMASALPIDGLYASLDYSMTAVTDTPDALSGNSFTGDQNHLLHLRLERQWQELRYGLRYFSAGENFGTVELGQELLHQAGVQAATDGAELWATLRLVDIELHPVVRRLAYQQADHQLTDNQYELTARHTLYQATQLEYLYYASVRTTDQPQSNNPQPLDETSVIGVRLNHPHWQLAWSSQSHRGSDEGSAESQQNDSAALTLGYQPRDPRVPRLNLTLRYSHKAGIRENASDMKADLGIRKHFYLPGARAAQTSVGASLSYRRHENTLKGLRDGVVGIQITFEHTVGS